MSHKTQVLAYVRVSTKKQKLDRQVHGLDKFDIDKVFSDFASAKSQHPREGLAEMMDYARAGDKLLTPSMDRLARSQQDLQDIVQKLNQKGVTVCFLKEGLTFGAENNAINVLMLQIIGAVAQFERSLINDRIREGIAAARARGHEWRGRAHKLDENMVRMINHRLKNGEKVYKISADIGIHRDTIRKARRRYAEKLAQQEGTQ
jgi:DNA invertase Pin-like site-specific DNA recombinase